MNKADVLSIARQKLSEAISNFQTPSCDPLNVSPWIVMSLMQKAIRRGEEQLALRAAATLLHVSPERLWRRCSCIAFEDVGVADLGTVAIVTAALAGKRNRASLGGEWRVASYIVSRMVHAPKCRGADDLLMTAELHPTFTEARREFAAMSTRELLALMIGGEALPVRALACWFAIGTDQRPSYHLSYRDPHAVFDALNDAGYPDVLVEMARENFSRTREVLAPFIVLLWPSRQLALLFLADDEMPPEIMVADVPGCRHMVDVGSHGPACADATEILQLMPDDIPVLNGVRLQLKGGSIR